MNATDELQQRFKAIGRDLDRLDRELATLDLLLQAAIVIMRLAGVQIDLPHKENKA